MQFVSNRDIVVVGPGHAIEFKKGEPTDVPRIMHKACLEKGVIPVEDPAGNAGSVADADDKPRLLLRPEDGEEMNDKILEALIAIVQRNDTRDFDAGGMPTAASVTAITGWKVDRKDVRKVWEEFRAELLTKK